MKHGIAALALALALPASAAAQLDVDLRLTPRAGVVTPADWFYVEYAHLGIAPVEWTEAAIQAGPLVGLTAEVELGASNVWIRGEVLRTLDGETNLTHALLVPMIGFDPPRVDRTLYTVPSSLTIGSVDLAFPTAFRIPFLDLQPYVTAGVGGKRYEFDLSGLPSDLDRSVVLPEEGTTLVFNLGGGATATVLGLDLDILVRDALSYYWDEQQHEVMVLVGLVWTAF